MTAHCLVQRPSRTLRTVTLLTLSGKVFATAGFLPGDPGAPWEWMQETVAHEQGVREEDVGCLEGEDGDYVTVDGEAVYRVARPALGGEN